MDFTFSEDQQLLQKTVRDFLEGEHPPELLRELWESESGRSPALWRKLAEVGIPGLLVPEEHEGMGMDEVDFVLLQEEIGRAALVEPVVSTAAVAVPLLREIGDPELARRWLERIAVGEATVAVGHPVSPLVADAHVADLLLLCAGDDLHAVDPAQAALTAEPATDPGRRLFSVAWTPGDATRVASGERGRALQDAALDRGALACAAQQIGVADRLIAIAAEYAGQRRQFGVAIGSFQAVKHMLANAKVKLEYARPLVQRAAHSTACAAAARSLHVSMAKVAASDAATLAARIALQVHGAIGYTWEQDLHIWMRRAWSLEQAWGRSEFHRRRVESAVLSDGARLGPGETFGGE